MLSSRCEQNALVGIFTRSESHFLSYPFLAGLFAYWTWMNCCFVWGGCGDGDRWLLLARMNMPDRRGILDWIFLFLLRRISAGKDFL